MSIAGAEYTVDDLYTGTVNTKDVTNLKNLMDEYLAKSKIAFKGTEAKTAYNTTARLKFQVSANGTITVKLYKNDTDVLTAKNVKYEVTR